MSWLLLLLACARPAPADPPSPSACPAADPLAPAAIPDPARWLARQLEANDVLALGEFHGLAPQIQLVSQVLAEASALGLSVDLGAELLPASRQSALDAMTSGASWEPDRWAEVVAGRPLLGPLALRDYLEPVHAAWTASRTRPTRVVGLSPPCDFEHAHDADGAIACLSGREAYMVERAEAEVLKKGRKLLLSAGFHHTSFVTYPGSEVEPPTATARLTAGHRVFSALIAGPMAREASGAWSRTCRGLLDAVGASRGGAPFAADLRDAPWETLTLDCLGDGAGSDPLSSAFDAVIWLGDPAAAPGPTPQPQAFFEQVGQPALQRWNRFEVELQGAPMGHLTQGADAWAGVAAAEAQRYTGLPLAPVTACAPIPSN